MQKYGKGNIGTVLERRKILDVVDTSAIMLLCTFLFTYFLSGNLVNKCLNNGTNHGLALVLVRIDLREQARPHMDMHCHKLQTQSIF